MQNTWVAIGLVALGPRAARRALDAAAQAAPARARTADARGAFPGGTLELGAPVISQSVTPSPASIMPRDALERRIRLAAAVGALHRGWGTPLE